MNENAQITPGNSNVNTEQDSPLVLALDNASATLERVGGKESSLARELGIPAVVGCGNATMRLHTGDWLRVNGELGTVEILRVAQAA